MGTPSGTQLLPIMPQSQQLVRSLARLGALMLQQPGACGCSPAAMACAPTAWRSATTAGARSIGSAFQRRMGAGCFRSMATSSSSGAAASEAAAGAAGAAAAAAARPRPRSLRRRLRAALHDYKQLSKAKLSALVVLTASTGFAAGSEEGPFDWAKLGWTSLGTFGAAACANTLNQVRSARTNHAGLLCVR